MSVVTATISDARGRAMPPTYELLALDVHEEVNRIPRCELRLIDGDLARGRFPISDDAFFEPGATIKVKLRYEGKRDRTVFKGLVVRHGLAISTAGSVLIVELRDQAIALTRPRRSAVFKEMTDAQVIRRLVTKAGLTARTITATAATHDALVQFRASDWDFIVTRAEAAGMVAVVRQGGFSLLPLAVTGAAARTFELGLDDIRALDLEADGLHQYERITSAAWDPQTQKRTAKTTAASVANPTGDLDGAKVAKALGFGECALESPAPLSSDELAAWAKGAMARSRLAMVRGRLAIAGDAALALLDVIALQGLGDRFAGEALVTGIRHRVGVDGWQTDLQLGATPAPFAERHRVDEPRAAGLLPSVGGLQIGVVAPFDSRGGAAHKLDVKVLLPGVDAKDGHVWARLASPDAGPGRGMFFRPEPGDEVVVGFFNGDPRQAVILGALYSEKNKPDAALTIDAKNEQRAIVSRAGVKITIVDADQPSITIETPDKRTIVLDDAEGIIVLKDSHDNKVTLGAAGVTIKSGKDLILDAASGEVTISGKKVDIQ